MKDLLRIAGRDYGSRLLVGTGKYKDFAQTRAAIEASGAEIVTVAIRRTNIGQTAGEPSLLDFLPPAKFTYLPNTAGCYSAADAVRTLTPKSVSVVHPPRATHAATIIALVVIFLLLHYAMDANVLPLSGCR